MIKDSFFNDLIFLFFGVNDYIDQSVCYPENEIKMIMDDYHIKSINKRIALQRLSQLTIFSYRFCFNGKVWNPFKESFKGFSVGKQVICAELPLREQVLAQELIITGLENLMLKGRVCQIKDYHRK